MRLFILLVFVFSTLHSSAQNIYGIVFSNKGDLLPFASITIKGTSVGAIANNKANFSFKIKPGKYVVVCQHIGFAKEEQSVTIVKDDEQVIFILKPQQMDLDEVKIKNSDDDSAYAIIKAAIIKRPFYNKQVNAFECNLYTKDIMKLRKLPNRVLGRKIPENDRAEMGLDTSGKGIIYLSESIAKLHLQQPDKFKMEVLSSRVSGSGSFGFTFPTFINLYENNVKIFTEKLNPRGFVSPIANGALLYYKYKFLGSFFEDGKEVNSIQVIPRRKYEPLFSGIIFITEGDWRIHSCNLSLTKSAQLEIIDTLQITQIHIPIENDVWRIKNQLLHFSFKQFGIDAIGDFVNVYSNYKIDPLFEKKFFNKIVISYDTAVNKKPKAYWDSIRPVPLEPEESRDYTIKDSIFQSQIDSIVSSRSIDSLNKRESKLNPLNIFWKGIQKRHFTKTTISNWTIQSLIKNLEYNTVEGVVGNFKFNYTSFFRKNKSSIFIAPNFRYGLSNGHLNAFIDVGFTKSQSFNSKNNKSINWLFSGGKRVSQFNNASAYTSFSNTINTLIWANNYMKIYENWFSKVKYAMQMENGVKLTFSAMYEDRMPLNNTTLLTLYKDKKNQFTANYPDEILNQQFDRHQATIVSFAISFKPGQKYIQFPRYKVSLGSKFPTFSLNYSKGIKNIFSSDVNFDKWNFNFFDDKNFRLAGELKYKIGFGGFLNNSEVYIQDYDHFNGTRTLTASEYVNSFQLAKYYEYSTSAKLYMYTHLEHHLNGLITNKIPLFKRLNWNAVVGSNSLYINKNNNTMEFFVGIENIFKIFRVDIITAYSSGVVTPFTFRIGGGGLLGKSLKPIGSGENLSIGL